MEMKKNRPLLFVQGFQIADLMKNGFKSFSSLTESFSQLPKSILIARGISSMSGLEGITRLYAFQRS
jgi:hypothetical protein